MVHPVHAQQHRLESLLSDQAPGAEQPRPGAGACLRPLLDALGWRGEARHVFESLPHFDELAEIDDLRAVLARLNYDAAETKRKVAELGAEQLPCLVDAGEGRTLIVTEREGDKCTVFDSATGEVSNRPVSEVSGRVFMIREIDVERERMDVLKHGWMFMLVNRFRVLFIQLLAVTFISNLFALAVPVYVMNVYDKVIGTRSTETLAYFFAGIGIIIFADLVLRGIRTRAMAYLGARFDLILGAAAFQQLLHLPITMIERAPMGSQITRLKQFEGIRDVFTGSMAAAVLDLPFVIVFIGAIIVIGGKLAFVPVSLIAVFAIIAAVSIPMTRYNVRMTGAARSKLQNFLIEAVSKQRTINRSAAQDVFAGRFRKLARETTGWHFRAQQTTNMIQTVSQALVTIAGVATIGLGAVFVMAGDLSMGALIAVMAFVWRVLAPIQSIFLSVNRLGQVIQSLMQVNRLMQMKPERTAGQVPSFYRAFEGAIVLNRVGFRYSPRAEPALVGLNLDIPAGQIVAVTGPSGNGSSTLLKVIAGLYAPQAGAVQIDGLDIRQLDSAEMRNAIGFVTQRATFFYGTVEQNLRLANPTATRLEIEQAAADAGLEDFSDILPDGLETRLNNEFQRRMPEGFKQRLMLARAYIKNPRIYLLDEPASGLDDAGDAALRKKLTSLRGHATVVMVTQRPSHMRLADRVVYLDQGQIVHDGKPEQILPLIYPPAAQ